MQLLSTELRENRTGRAGAPALHAAMPKLHALLSAERSSRRKNRAHR
jgi:hypothetical protein